MSEDNREWTQVVSIDEGRIRDPLGEWVRGTVEETLNAMRDGEADALCGAGRYQRSSDRVEDITQALWGTRVSSGPGSKLHRKLYRQIETWRNREIEEEIPPLSLDGIVLKRSGAGEVNNVSVRVAIGVGRDGDRRLLGVGEGHKEDQAGWSGLLAHLKQRGLQGVRWVRSDACLGLVESVSEYDPEADWQRGRVHFYRNVFSPVPSGKVKRVSRMLKAIDVQESRAAAVRKAREGVQSLRERKLRKASDWVEAVIEETLTDYSSPQAHWIRIRTHNPLERIRREIRRRTRVVGAFSDGNSALMLGAARLRHIAGTKGGTRKSLLMDELYRDEREQLIA